MKRRRKTAYSYIRFSDAKQAKGDSLRRQLEWGPALCRSKDWDLDERFDPDQGVSAFRGKNAATGALSKFLKAIRSGQVVAGDVLLVESLDRLSREDIDPAWELFRSILKSGVEIYTREPERHYLPTDLNNFGIRIEVQAYFLRAYNESATKSMRGKSYWAGLRTNLTAKKQPMHKVLPAWLRLSVDRQRIEPIPEAAEAVKLIYRWAAEGLGINPITARLNECAVPPIGGNIRRQAGRTSWCRSYVAKLLHDRAVMGEFQPHVMKDGKRVPHGEPIPDYFPQVVSETEWYAVRQAVKGRGVERGPRGVGIASLFTGLIRDARDGQTMHLTYAGSSRKNNTRVLVSYGSRNGESGSVHLPFPYDAVEQAFLQAVQELKTTDFLSDGPDTRETEITALATKRDDLAQKIAAVQQHVLEREDIEPLLLLLERLDKEKKAVDTALDRLKAANAHQQPTALKEAQSLIHLLASTKPEERPALRTKIKARVKQLVSEIWLLVWDVTPAIRAAEIQISFHSGRVRGIILNWLRRGKHRGFVIGGAGVLVQEGEDRDIPRLGAYRLDRQVQQWFLERHKVLAPAIAKAVEAEVKYRDLMARAKRQGFRSSEGTGKVS